MAILMYSQDWDERLPRAQLWMDAILPYLKVEDDLRCDDLDQRAGPKYGFALDSALAGGPSGDTRRSSRQVLLFDSWKVERNAADALESFAEPPRHGGKGNAGFLDDHVKAYTPAEWRVIRQLPR